ncbi:MAG: diaminopimelate decarboxylase [Spartobacteria bacterium]|nr:diaminopimelate decarboxylase [Spartobacteria bacterium]
MECFTYRRNELFAEDVPVAELARQYDTPLYVYSRSGMQAQYRALASAMAEVGPHIHFAVKSNSSAAVISLFAEEGAGADVVSAGEIFRAMRAGIDPAKIVFAGVGKTEFEIDYALEQGIHFFTVESEPELERLSKRAAAVSGVARVAIRVNPDVDPKTHKYTSTGKKESKFGVDLERALKAYELAARLPHLEIVGIHMHIGSPLMSVAPYEQALEKVLPVCDVLKKRYPTFRILDIGGGLGIKYTEEETPFDVKEFARRLTPMLKQSGLEIGMEPGRFLVGNAGILLTRVQYIKDNPFKKFVVVDGAMNDLIRPALYEAYHGVLPARKTEATILGDVVGPVCESGDFLARDRELPAVKQGDLLAIQSAGAYAFAMSSSYNSRPRAAEVMVHGERSQLIRARETWQDIVRGECIPNW